MISFRHVTDVFPTDTVDSILARFNDAGGFTPAEVVALLVS